LGGGPPRFPPDSPCPAVLGSTTTRAADRSPTGLSPPAAGLPRPFGSAPRRERDPAGSPIVSHNPDAATAAALARRRFGQSPFRSPLLRASRLLPLPRGTEMFQFPRFPPPAYGFSWRWPGMTRAGLPHSDTRGSRPVDGSPRLFAVPRVLHRPLAPRHPPRAHLRSAPPRGDPKPLSHSSLRSHHSSACKGSRAGNLWLKAH
jgi:hypothetical protein